MKHTSRNAIPGKVQLTLAKFSYILAVESSVDLLSVELHHSVLATTSDISSTVFDSLSAEKA